MNIRHGIVIFALTALSVPLCAQTTIRAVVNAASQTPASIPGDVLAPGMQVKIAGTKIGPVEPVTATAYPYPTSEGLGGVTGKVTVGGASADLIFLSASAEMVTAVLPSNVPVGPGTVTLNYDGGTATAQVTIAPANPGIFTVSGQAAGLVSAMVVGGDGTMTAVSADAPARPGQTVALSATGLGAVASDEAAAPDSSDLSTDLTVYVGGKAATVQGKKRAGTAPGLDLISVVVPDGLNSCGVPVVVVSGTLVSNFVALPVSPDGPCADPFLRQTDLERIQQQGEFRTGSITLSRGTIAVQGFDITSESASATFVGLKIISLSPGQYLISGNATAGSCVVTVSGALDPQAVVDFRLLDAGAALSLSGPKGDRPMAKQSGAYSASLGTPSIPLPGAPPPQTYLDPGEYTVTGPGGPDVGAFTAKITIGPALNWTNRATVGNAGNDVIDRSKDVTVTWTGGRPADLVSILGTAAVSSTRVAVSFQCLEVASAGKFTIPAWVLSALPPVAQGTLSLAINNSATFTASGIDSGNLLANSTSQRTITYR